LVERKRAKKPGLGVRGVRRRRDERWRSRVVSFLIAIPLHSLSH
jgi:hypothetical protein